jgi:hypothetical protein
MNALHIRLARSSFRPAALVLALLIAAGASPVQAQEKVASLATAEDPEVERDDGPDTLVAAEPAPVPELFYQGDRRGGPETVATASIVAEHDFADGRLFFVVLPNGDVGVVAAGQAALRAVNGWMGEEGATALEVYQATGGDPATAPVELQGDHWVQRQERGEELAPPRSLPSLEELFAGRAPQGAPGPGGSGFWHDWFADSSACGDEDLGLFWYWFQHKDYDVWGAKGVAGHGEWTGDANITLGGTSKGVIAVCPYEGIAELKIWEYVPGIGWVFIMDIPNFGGFAYGYIFQGWQIRHVRMTVREYDKPFFWAASY